MKTIEINVLVWKVKEKDLQLVERILAVINSKVKKVKISFGILDLYSFNLERNSNPTITFGDNVTPFIPENTEEIKYLKLPELDLLEDKPENILYRKQAMKDILEFSTELEELAEESKYSHGIKVESNGQPVIISTDEQQVGDISLTKEEISNLKRLKDLFNGGNVVFRKGDIEIEVKDDRD